MVAVGPDNYVNIGGDAGGGVVFPLVDEQIAGGVNVRPLAEVDAQGGNGVGKGHELPVVFGQSIGSPSDDGQSMLGSSAASSAISGLITDVRDCADIVGGWMVVFRYSASIRPMPRIEISGSAIAHWPHPP